MSRVPDLNNKSGEAETALLEAGVAEFICAGGDALAILEDTLAVALGERQSWRIPS